MLLRLNSLRYQIDRRESKRPTTKQQPKRNHQEAKSKKKHQEQRETNFEMAMAVENDDEIFRVLAFRFGIPSFRKAQINIVRQFHSGNTHIFQCTNRSGRFFIS